MVEAALTEEAPVAGMGLLELGFVQALGGAGIVLPVAQNRLRSAAHRW